MRLAIAASLLLAACSSTPEVRVAADAPTSTMKDRSVARSVQVQTVDLPEYAEAEDVAIQQPDGTILLMDNTLWADSPSRALTASLVRNLMTITGATVAAEPWPLREYPEAELTVRVEKMVVQSTGSLTLTGQYIISNEERENLSRDRLFSIEVPVALTQEGAVTPTAVAHAHGLAWVRLAEKIARDL